MAVVTDTTDPQPTSDARQDPAPEAPPPDAGADGEAPRRRTLLRRRTRRIDPGTGDPDPAAAQQTGVIAPAPGDQATGVIESPPPPAAPRAARLRRDRKRLMAEREVLLFHLGGLAFELYRRDMLTEEVARRRAGAVADLDEAVREIDRQLAEADAARRARRHPVAATGPEETGCCTVCRAPFYADARFCMQCGGRFAPADPAAPHPTDTQVIPAADA